jgi:hypothetical protein
LKLTATVFQWLIRLTGLLQVVLGVFIWTGNYDSFIGIHTVSGVVLVLSLVVLAGLAATSGIHWGRVTLAFIWAVVVLVFGLTQERILPGSSHWVIQVVHLLLGLGAIGQGEFLGRLIKARLAQRRAAVGSTVR